MATTSEGARARKGRLWVRYVRAAAVGSAYPRIGSVPLAWTVLVAALAVWPAAPSQAGFHAGFRIDTPLLDSLEVVVRPREVLAIDAGPGSGVVAERLEVGENVLWTGARGRLGVVVTDKRVLAIAARAASWREVRYLIQESLPLSVLLGDRVALIVTSRRVIGVTGATGSVVVQDIGLHEAVIDGVVGENVAVVITDRRVLGLSAFAGGFIEERVPLHEDVEYASAGGNLATITTRRRLLIFRAPTGTWENRDLGLYY